MAALLESFVRHPGARVGDLQTLTESEQRELLREWNGGSAPRRDRGTVQTLFEDQARQTPDAVAAASNEQMLTYRELDGRASILAHRLARVGVSDESRVGTLLEDGFPLVIALLGVLKAGGACVPLDPGDSPEMLSSVFTKARLSAVVTEEKLRHHLNHLAGVDAMTICVDHTGDFTDCTSSKVSRGLNSETHRSVGSGRALACLIYTAGRSGEQKAVAIEHGNLVSHIESIRRAFIRNNSEMRVMTRSGMTKRMAVLDLLAPLVSGGQLVLCDDHAAALPNVDLFNTTPGALTQLIGTPSIPPTVATVVISSEPLTYSCARQMRGIPGTPTFMVMYGCAEVTGCATYGELEYREGEFPLGGPSANASVFVLDQHFGLAPLGAPGLMYVAGEGVARGYDGDAGMTASAFIPNPFSDRHGERMVGTADFSRFATSGQLEFLGRRQDIVKLGSRSVSLWRLRDFLEAWPPIEAAFVTMGRGHGQGELLFYYEAKPDAAPTEGEVRQHLKQIAGMADLEPRIIRLDRLPRTESGEIDDRLLPGPAGPRVRSSKIAPRDMIEYQLAAIWEDVLGIRAGVTDDFFELGGSSLLALRLAASIQLRMGRSLPINVLVENPTIEHIAALFRSQAASDWSPLVPLQVKGSRPPIFCFHAGDGYVAAYLKLAKRLGEEQPCYGLQARGLQEGQEPFRTVEEMARSYLNAIRAARVSPPYIFCGQSVGGIIAFEAAQQMMAEGEPVALLAMFDTHRLASNKAATYETLYNRHVDRFVHQYAGRLGLSREELDLVSTGDRLSHVVNLALSAGILPRGTTGQRIQQMIEFNVVTLRALYSYQLRPYSGRVVLFRAAESRAAEGDGAHELGWRDLCSGLFEAEETPGSHLNQILEPNVGVLAERLKVHLRRALSISGD
ncbi:MAG TPA: AMP-binding protein, partial [Blastocatellia bacterium]|nr:AMP-binding protein [Blastocatellia bacterium]